MVLSGTIYGMITIYSRMIKVMQNVQPDCVVLIDSLKVISPAQWEEWEL
jgi:hypothetical protein